MTTRTIKQLGIAYGAEPANITAKIDNVVVYQGTVNTLNAPFPNLPDLNYTVSNELFSWTTDVNFTGPQTLEIDIDGNVNLLVADIVANYTPIQQVSNTTGNISIVSSGPDGFVGFSWPAFGNTYVDGGFVPADGINHDPLAGQWWFVPTVSFVESFTVPQGLE